MDAIYRCRTSTGKIVEIDADSYDSIGIIKGLAQIVHGVRVDEVLNEVVCSKRREDVPETRLPDSLRRFIETGMAQSKHLICHFSSYVMVHKIPEEHYQFVLDAMIQREKEEDEQRVDDKILETGKIVYQGKTLRTECECVMRKSEFPGLACDLCTVTVGNDCVEGEA